MGIRENFLENGSKLLWWNFEIDKKILLNCLKVAVNVNIVNKTPGKISSIKFQERGEIISNEISLIKILINSREYQIVQNVWKYFQEYLEKLWEYHLKNAGQFIQNGKEFREFNFFWCVWTFSLSLKFFGESYASWKCMK